MDAFDAAADRNGDIRVTVTGGEATVARAARRFGGRALASVGNTTSVLIPKNRVASLDKSPGVGTVSLASRLHAQAAPSEGVSASGADGWQASAPGNGGAGVTIAIVDLGFANYASTLPASTTLVNEDCRDSAGNTTVDDEAHGTAVAEIVHEMAPQAVLKLYCIAGDEGFANAATDIGASGIKIVNYSVGDSGDSRGDGTGAAGSAADTVAKSRRNDGVLWVVAAGNEAGDHWGGYLSDTDKDGYVDIDGPYNPAKHLYENDIFFVASGDEDQPSVADLELQWDNWPTSSQNVVLQATGFQCSRAYDSDGDCGAYPIQLNGDGTTQPTADGQPVTSAVGHHAGSKPFSAITIANTQPFEQYWVTEIRTPKGGYGGTRYDLNYEGDVSGPSALSCASFDANGNCVVAPRSYQGSVTVPASSPYAFAVGAADVGVDGRARGTLEPFSSQGPSIDGRTKPDIAGWDGVSSPVYGVPNSAGTAGFYGTSAAAPHVAGAAALIKAADPSLDASGLQRALTDRASSSTASGAQPISPPNNRLGAGLLTLGTPPASSSDVEPAGARYTPVTSTRLLDTRTTTGGHQSKLGAGGTVTVAIPSDTPSDATAVAINLTGVGATAGATYLTAYPGPAVPPTSNLNLAKTVDPTAATFAVVRINRSSATPTITVRNNLGTVDAIVDELGYFGTGAEVGRLTTLATPDRVLDTRTTSTPIPSKGSRPVNPDLPEGATAAVVNLTVASPPPAGYVTASADCPAAGTVPTTSLLNYAKRDRSNLAIVPVGADGRFCLSNDGGSVNAIVDVVGYMSAGSGADFYALPSAQRIIDTRYGNGGNGAGKSSAPLNAGQTAAFAGSGVGVVPANATALFTNVVEASNTRGGYLALVPGSAAPSGAGSTVGFSPGRIVANASVVGLSGHQFSVYNAVGTVQFAADVAGYFSTPAG